VANPDDEHHTANSDMETAELEGEWEMMLEHLDMANLHMELRKDHMWDADDLGSHVLCCPEG
jgi:hypothetical protein